jgi:hypothetical protein
MCQKEDEAPQVTTGDVLAFGTLTLIIGIILGSIIMGNFVNSGWKWAGIQHNAGYYDADSAEWRWNDQTGKRRPEE